MPTQSKKDWIGALASAGIREIEVGSFVSPRLLPQMQDTAEIVQHAKTRPNLEVAVLVPNLKGAELAIAAGADKITLPLSVSETHSIRNIRRTHAQVLSEAEEISKLIKQLPKDQRPHFEGSLSTAFGCTLEGRISQDTILTCAEKLMHAGATKSGFQTRQVMRTHDP